MSFTSLMQRPGNFRVASLMKSQGQRGEGGPSLNLCGVDWPIRKPSNPIYL